MKQDWIYFTDFMFWLKQHDCYLAYITNTKGAGNDPRKIFNKVATARGKIESVLRQSFEWDGSPEGYRYWLQCQDCLIRDFMDRFPKKTPISVGY